MTRRADDMPTCDREQDVLDAIHSGRWPSRAGEELPTHVEQCACCRDVATVAAAISFDRAESWAEANLPSASVVWFRAQMRARTEDARRAGQPMTIVQAIGVACALGVLGAVIGTLAWSFRSWTTWLSHVTALAAGAQTTFDLSSLAARGVLFAVAVWLVLAPVAVYLAATED